MELYVMGLLPEEDARKMEQLLLLFPELKEEADRISETLEALAMQTTVAPRAEAKDRIFETLAGLKDVPNEAEKPVAAPVRSIEENKPSPAKVIPLQSRRKNYLLAASVAGLVLSLAAVLFLWSSNRNLKSNTAALEREVQTITANNNSLQAQQLAYEQTLRLLQDASVNTITLQPVPGKPQSSVKVFWNRASKEVFVLDLSLPQAPAGKQYQLWAIVNGQPISAGLLSGQKNEPQKMTAFDKADAFAITLENSGGSAAPTMEQLLVLGKTS
ncbi:anti-sigma factor [Flavisolibacter sp. BT320]|nr:anti-sigma factor [Flavisolibacter longurius]